MAFENIHLPLYHPSSDLPLYPPSSNLVLYPPISDLPPYPPNTHVQTCKSEKYLNTIRNNFLYIKVCTKDCKKLASHFDVRLCDNFIIKLSHYRKDFDSLKKESQNYLIIHENPKLKHLIYKMPIYYEDSYNNALLFDNTDKIETLYYMSNFLTYIELKEAFSLLVKEMRLLNSLNFYHGDLHMHNVLYKDGKIYMIDLEYLVLPEDNKSDHKKFIDNDLLNIETYENLSNSDEETIRLALVKEQW